MTSTQPARYFRVERLLLKIGGISFDGNESLAYRIYSASALLLFTFPYPFIVCVDLFKQDFNDAINSWFYAIATFVVVPVISLMYPNRIKLGVLFSKLEKEPFTANVERGGEDEVKLLKGWISFTYMQGMAFLVGLLTSVFGQMVYTFMKRVTSSDYHDWSMGFASISIINVTYSPNFEIAWLYQTISLFYISFNMCSTTLIISGTLAFISVQFKMLQNNLRRIVGNCRRKTLENTRELYWLTERTFEDSSKIFWQLLEASLKNTIDYHLSIIKIATEIEEIFTKAILSIYVITLAVLCLEIYRASLLPMYDIRTLRLLIETLSGMFHSFLICYCGDQMTYESQEVSTAAFESNFIMTNLKFQKSIVLISRRSQQSVRIKAGKLIETSLVTFAWILRTSYSAYMMLRNTNKQE